MFPIGDWKSIQIPQVSQNGHARFNRNEAKVGKMVKEAVYYSIYLAYSTA